MSGRIMRDPVFLAICDAAGGNVRYLSHPLEMELTDHRGDPDTLWASGSPEVGGMYFAGAAVREVWATFGTDIGWFSANEVESLFGAMGWSPDRVVVLAAGWIADQVVCIVQALF